MENELVTTIEAMCGTLESHPQLKSLAECLGVPPQRIYSVAKQPIEGREYNAKEFNWDAINRFCARRLEGKFDSFEDLITAALERDIQSKTEDGRNKRKVTSRGTRVKASDIELADGTTMPARKIPLEVGQIIMMRSDKAPIEHEVLLVTPTHVCVQQVGTTVLTSYSNWTLNQKCVADAEARALLMEERKAGKPATETVPTPEEPVVEE